MIENVIYVNMYKWDECKWCNFVSLFLFLLNFFFGHFPIIKSITTLSAGEHLCDLPVLLLLRGKVIEGGIGWWW